MNQEIKADRPESNDLSRDALFNSIPAPMYIYQRDSLRIIKVNDTFVDSYGYTREEAVKMKSAIFSLKRRGKV